MRTGEGRPAEEGQGALRTQADVRQKSLSESGLGQVVEDSGSLHTVQILPDAVDVQAPDVGPFGVSPEAGFVQMQLETNDYDLKTRGARRDAATAAPSTGCSGERP